MEVKLTDYHLKQRVIGICCFNHNYPSNSNIFTDVNNLLNWHISNSIVHCQGEFSKLLSVFVII